MKRRKQMRRKAANWFGLSTGAVLLAGFTAGAAAQQTTTFQMTNTGAMHIADVASKFATPPDNARIMMRWWWFGPAVTDAELKREILAMKAGGIGGFEIQPVYPQGLDDTKTGFRNLPYLSQGFLNAVHFANETGHANGMRVDITLGSGWPYGGPDVPVNLAAGRLRVVTEQLAAGQDSLPAPSLENGESLIAAFAGPAGGGHSYDPSKLREIPVKTEVGRLQVAPEGANRAVVFFIASHTGQQVKRASVGAEGYVLDHYQRAAIDQHLHDVADKLITAFGSQPPFSVFSDSLEVFGSDWTNNFLEEFQRRRGYDLKPYLPELAAGTDEKAAEIRHDWGLTLSELATENYLEPLNAWALAHGTHFRSQSYGMPPVKLAGNRLVSLPEGEGPQWDRFSFARWASSANHLYGKNVTSAETWTWIHSPAFTATPLDMKAEADRFLLEGVNQFVGHGWPYSPPGLTEPGWQFYAAGALNDHNPWYIAMPDVTAYLQRMSYIMRQGKPANDVAVLLPEDDAFAAFRPGRVSLTGEMARYVTPELTQQIESAGHNLDYIDAEAIGQVGIHYSALVLPHVERLSPETLRSIQQYVDHGGKVIAVGTTPHLAPGFHDAAEVTKEVEQLAKKLFASPGVQVVSADADLGAALGKAVEPDLKISADAGEVGFVHRRLADADLYFVVNTSNHPVQATGHFSHARKFVAEWNPMNGKRTELEPGDDSLNLAPYESRVFVLSDSPEGNTAPAVQGGNEATLAELDHGWTLRFEGARSGEEKLNDLESWTKLPGRQFFSGQAVYRHNVSLKASELGGKVLLDFGKGTPAMPNPEVKSGMRALLDAPIRDVAVVTVNGKHVGDVWCPPYRLDISSALHAGENTIEVRVANTAINEEAGEAPADFRLLWLRYGQRAVNQNVDHLQPLPSGLLGPVRLVRMK